IPLKEVTSPSVTPRTTPEAVRTVCASAGAKVRKAHANRQARKIALRRVQSIVFAPVTLWIANAGWKRLMFEAVGVPNAAERHVEQLPCIFVLPVDLGDGEFSRRFVASEHCVKRDAVPQNGRVAEHFDHRVVDVGLPVVNAPTSDDLDLRFLAPGAAHVNES